MPTPPAPEVARTTATAGLVGKVLSDRYRIQAILGEGGMGAVYLAEHVLMRKRLAVKVLHPEMTRMPEVVARFEREAMAAAHIEHPNVAAATDFGKLEDGSFFLVLEYVEGTSLRDMLVDGPVELPRALHVVEQIACALARAHSLGIVHRDLKPENVMLVERDGDRDFVKVLDFGIAKVPVGDLIPDAATKSGQVLTQLGMVYGTPEYMAPEQALGQDVDARADLYALGVILYEMLTGYRPFDADSKVVLLGMKVTQDAPSMMERNPAVHLPVSVDGLVLRLLEREAGRRFQDAREVVEAIASVGLTEAKTEPPTRVRSASGALEGPYRVGLGLARAGTPERAQHAPAVRARSAGVTLATRVEPAVSALWSSLRGWGDRLAHIRARLWPAVRSTVVVLTNKLPRPNLTALRLPGRADNASGEPARSIPAYVWIAGACVLLTAVVLLLLGGPRGPRPGAGEGGASASANGTASQPAEKPTMPTTASSAELAAASGEGSEALEALGKRFPKDAAVVRALVLAHAREKRLAEAMVALGRLCDFGAARHVDAELEEIIMAAARADVEASDLAFALLEERLGARGPDLLYELSVGRSPTPRVPTRARQSLAKAEVRAMASPSLVVLMEFRNAKSCEVRRNLLARARTDGDARLLPFLRAMTETKGCGFLSLGDCWSCMRRDGQLGTAIQAIEERGAK